jgi:hypothetical protein
MFGVRMTLNGELLNVVDEVPLETAENFVKSIVLEFEDMGWFIGQPNKVDLCAFTGLHKGETLEIRVISND